MHIIAADHLKKSYGKQVAVDGLSFEIQRGETFGLLGPNGAGKTTTIGMLVGLIQPDSGSVTVGTDPQSAGSPVDPSIRRLIGVAPQRLSLYEELSARENLEFFGRLYGLSGGQLKQQVDWALDFAKLADRQKDRIGTYSGGMKRRINIAAALVHQPEILLLDEPTVGVDPQSRNHIFDCIEQLQHDGKTVLYTTHYMEEAQRLCDRVAIVDQGKLLALDSVEGLIQQHGGTSVVSGDWLHCPDSIEFPGNHEGNQFRFESTQPLDQVTQLTNQGVQFQSLTITRPDLESVFLALTGRSLRDS